MKRTSASERETASELLVRQRLGALTKALPAAQRGDKSALHQARVASRRMRETLPLITTGGKGRKLERNIRRITRALGPVRELDVASQMLDELVTSGRVSRQAVGRLRDAVAKERDAMGAEMRRRLEAIDVQKLRKRTMAAAKKQEKAMSAGSAARVERLAAARERAANRAERLHAAVEDAGSLYLPDRLHEVRIAVKKLRYSLELVRDLSRSRSTARIHTLKTIQDLLGRMHDLEVLIARVRTAQSSPNAPPLKGSGELDRFVRELENDCRQLHGHYTAAKESLLAVCDYAINAAEARRDVDAA